MGRYISIYICVSFLACGLFNTSIRATAGETKATGAMSDFDKIAKEQSRRYESEFQKFIEDNKERYKSLFQNDLLLNAFEDFGEKFDFEDIEVDYSDISRIIADWTEKKGFEKEFKKEFEKEFFKEINKKRTEQQNWRIHSWVFKNRTTDFNQEEIMEKLSKEKVNKILEENNITDMDKLIEEAKALLLDKYKGTPIEVIDDHKPFVALAVLLRKQNRSLPIWKIRQTINNVLEKHFKEEFSRFIQPVGAPESSRPLSRNPSSQSLAAEQGTPIPIKRSSSSASSSSTMSI